MTFDATHSQTFSTMFTKKTFLTFLILFLASVFCQNLTAQPVNDNPCGAVELVAVDGQNCTPQSPYSWIGATASPNIPAPGCASYTTGDVWFKFTLAVKSDVFLTTAAGGGAGAITDGGMAVYSATACDGTFTKLKCDDDTGPGSMPQILITLNPGTYFVRFWDYGDKTTANFGGICLATKAILVVAPNDDPCQAIALPIVAADSCAPANPFSWEGATASSVTPPFCGSYSTGDTWFKFSLSDTSNVDISTLAGLGNDAITDAAMALYSANACDGALTEMICNNNYGTNPMPRIKRNAMLPGTYYIRFWDVLDKTTGNIGGICVAATTPDFPPALNDEPCGAIEISVAAADICIPQNPYSWGYATASANFTTPTCGSYTTGDIWFKFSLTEASDVLITTKAGSGIGAITDGAMILYKADLCNGSFAQVLCDDESGPGSMPQISELALPAGQYFVRFWDYQDNPSGNIGGICVAWKPTVSTVPNDLCITASPFPDIPVDGSCASVEVNTTGATGLPLNNCGAIADDDVWYSFIVPPAQNKLAYVFTQNGIPTTKGLRIYSGICGQLVSVACAVGAEGILQPLNPGQTYFARTSTVAQGDGGAEYSFCLSAVVPPANDDPCGALVLPVAQNANFCLPNNPISWKFATATQGIPTPGCGSYASGDIWFKFSLSEQSEVTIKTAAGLGPNGITDGAMALYYANGCNSLTKIICNDDETPQLTMPALHNVTLIPGEYYIRFWDYEDKISGNIGGICVAASPSVSNHENELCVSATPFPAIPADGTCASMEINTSHATGLYDVPLQGFQDDDLWYQFSTPAGVTKLLFDIEFFYGNQQLMLQIYDACGQDSPIKTIEQEKNGVIQGLAENTSYWLRVYTYETGVSAHFELCLSVPPPPPANDLCSSPALFPIIPEDGTPATTEVAYQWAKNNSYTCYNYEGGDVWFQFTVPDNATSLMASFEIPQGSDASPIVEVLGGSCNNLISINCFNNGYFDPLRINGLVPGASYLLRATANKDDFGPYSISLRVPPDPPTNDLCANAIPFPLIPLNGDCSQLVANTRGATGDNSQGCSGIFDDDVWYTFTVPMGYTQLFATQKALAGADISALAVYSGTCNNLSLVSCHFPSDSLLDGLTEGQTYFMRVYSLFANEETQVEICLRVAPIIIQPNDHCPDAVAFAPISTDGSWSNVVGSTWGASPSGLPACDGSADDDVWYSFTMPVGYDKLIYKLDVIDDLNNGLILEIYEGHCGSLNFKGCYKDNKSSHFSGLVGGQAYFLRVFSQSPDVFMNFSIGLRVPEVLKNDLCENAIAFPALPHDGSSVCLQGNTTLATGANDPWCSGVEDDDVWYTFTVPEDRTSVYFEIWTNFGNRAQVVTYAGTCDNLVTMGCHSQTYVIDDISGLQPNQTYYIQVFSNNANVSTDFELCLSKAPGPPANDHCAEALSITNSAGAFEDPGLQTLKGATLSNLPICAQYTGEILPFDVWYSFTTDQDGGDALINLQALEEIYYFGYTGLGMQAFSGDCASFSTIWCGGEFDNGLPIGMPLYNLTGSTTYHFRVFGLTTTGGYAPQDFLINATGTAFEPISQSKMVDRSSLQSGLSITKVFPSPAQSQVTVAFEAAEAGQYQLAIFDLAGRLIEETSLQAQQGLNHQTIEVAHLPAGMYVGQIITENQKRASFRFVKAE